MKPTIDDERLQALAESVEILRDTAHDTSAAVTELRGTVEVQRDTLNALMSTMMKPLLESMHVLADAVNNHEQRITGIEDRI